MFSLRRLLQSINSEVTPWRKSRQAWLQITSANSIFRRLFKPALCIQYPKSCQVGLRIVGVSPAHFQVLLKDVQLSWELLAAGCPSGRTEAIGGLSQAGPSNPLPTWLSPTAGILMQSSKGEAGPGYCIFVMFCG